MNLDSKKVKLIEWLASLQDQTLLDKIEELRKQAMQEAYDAGLRPMSMEAYEAMIAESEEDIQAGRIYSHEEVVNYFKNKS